MQETLLQRLWRYFRWVVAPTPYMKAVKRWRADNGNVNLRFDYPLTPSAVVLDIGGFHGDWAAEVYERFQATVYVFEPVKAYAEMIQARFVAVPKVLSHAFGLGGTTETLEIALLGDRSSTVSAGAQVETVSIVDIVTWLESNSIDNVDLIKLNIEGGEFALLERLLDAGLIGNFNNIQVQFHDTVPNALARMRAIQDRLSQTHTLTWQYEFVWENWQRKD